MANEYANYDGRCPSCHAGILMVNCSWAECVSPYCQYPYSCNGVWVRDSYGHPEWELQAHISHGILSI